MNNLLQGKIAVSTGGNSGIGLESAKLFKLNGASIVIIGQNEVTLASAKAALGGRHVIDQSQRG